MFKIFTGNILNLSENIAKSFRGATFLTHTVRYYARSEHSCCANSPLIHSQVRLSTE